MSIKQILVLALIGTTAIGIEWHKWSIRNSARTSTSTVIAANPVKVRHHARRTTLVKKHRPAAKRAGKPAPWLAMRKVFK